MSMCSVIAEQTMVWAISHLLPINLKFQWAILSQFNIAISVVNGPFFCWMGLWTMAPTPAITLMWILWEGLEHPACVTESLSNASMFKAFFHLTYYLVKAKSNWRVKKYKKADHNTIQPFGVKVMWKCKVSKHDRCMIKNILKKHVFFSNTTKLLTTL